MSGPCPGSRTSLAGLSVGVARPETKYKTPHNPTARRHDVRHCKSPAKVSWKRPRMQGHDQESLLSASPIRTDRVRQPTGLATCQRDVSNKRTEPTLDACKRHFMAPCSSGGAETCKVLSARSNLPNRRRRVAGAPLLPERSRGLKNPSVTRRPRPRGGEQRRTFFCSRSDAPLRAESPGDCPEFRVLTKLGLSPSRNRNQPDRPQAPR